MSNVIVKDMQILGGEPVFKGTRVPVKSLFNHLKAGDSIEVFLDAGCPEHPPNIRKGVLTVVE